MSILSWIVVSLIAGWLAGMVIVMKGGGNGVVGDIHCRYHWSIGWQLPC